MKPNVAHLAELARRSGGEVRSREKPAEPEPTPQPTPDPAPDGAEKLAEAIRMLPAMMPPPSVIEVPSQIEAKALGEAIAAAIREAQTQQTKPVAWRLKVKRDVDGLIEYLDLIPRQS